MEGLRSVLKEHGVQITKQRLEVYQILKELNTHVSADDILQVLQGTKLCYDCGDCL